MPPKRWHSASPAPRARHTSPSYPPPSRKPVFIINWRPSKATMYFYFFYFLPLHSTPQTMGQRPPHVPPRSRLLSNTPLTVATTFGWLLCPPIKRRPSKAKGPPISLFFCRLFRPPKQRAAVLPTRSDPASPLLQRTL
jgi:hypothetical protein